MIALEAWQSDFALRDTEADVVSGPDLRSDAIQYRAEKYCRSGGWGRVRV